MNRFCALALLVVAQAGVAKPPPQREAELRAITLVSADGGVVALVTPVMARVAPNRTRSPSVGILATSARPTGDQWLTTLWRSAFAATEATNTSLVDFEFSLHVEGAIDGPSAGVLTASTLAALIRGKKPLAATSMIGALNPDGSVGPVDDVLPRLRAAAADGLKRFGVPLGARQQADASGSVVDLIAEGKRLGVTVKELGTLDEAYSFLTNDTLPRPAAATEADMELWPAELAALSQSTAQVRAEFEAERPQAEAVIESSWKPRLERAARQAADFEKSGDPVRALVVWSSALTTVRLATQLATLTKSLEPRDLDAVFRQLDSAQTAFESERAAFRKEIDEKFPNTSRANDLYAMDLLESVAAQGPGSSRLTQLRALPAGDASLSQLARQYAEELLHAREDVKNGRRFFSMYSALPRLKKSLPALDAARLSAFYATAGSATHASLRARLSPEMEKDETFHELTVFGELLNSEPDARAKLVLAARQNVYSAYLVNLYAALGASVDANGIFSVRNARALSVQLEVARGRALQSCGKSKRDTAMIPFAARLRYLNARAAREGSDRQKSESLAELWLASWWCELASGTSR